MCTLTVVYFSNSEYSLLQDLCIGWRNWPIKIAMQIHCYIKILIYCTSLMNELPYFTKYTSMGLIGSIQQFSVL